MINPIQQKVYYDAIADGMPTNMANLIAAQSAHETGNYTSNAFLQDNNLFGYKNVPGAKWEEGAGIDSSEGDPYAKYETIEDSVHEIVDWIGRRQKESKFPSNLSTITTPEQYATLLKSCGYFGDTTANYIAGLDRFYQDFNT